MYIYVVMLSQGRYARKKKKDTFPMRIFIFLGNKVSFLHVLYITQSRISRL